MRNWSDHNVTKGCYSFGTTVNPVVGFSSLNTRADNRTSSVMRYFFVRTKPCCAQIMVGRNGETFASAGSSSASLSTLLRLATSFSSGEVRLENLTREATDMVTTPTPLYLQYIWHFCSFQLQRFITVRTETEACSLLPDFAASIRLEVAA